MTLNKRGLRLLFDEWLSDFSINARFEVDIDQPEHDTFNVAAQPAKKRIPHPEQDILR